MLSFITAVLVLGLTFGAQHNNHTHHNVHQHHTRRPTTTPAPTLDPLSDKGRIANLEEMVAGLAQQVMLQQLFVEERIRSDGDSGVKQLRLNQESTKPYMSIAHTHNSMLSIHDHSNYDRTCGMGEFIAVMNGVEFRTRHNDYKLRMPSRTTSVYNAMDDIPFPPVPASVTNKPTVAAQIAEMKEYFKAWKYQNHNHRDYRPYFKPVLCYLETAWTSDTKTFKEPFESDRHAVDATSWFDLQNKIRYTSYSGSKSNLENYSYLPTTIMNVINGKPEYAQWNYRILCHPLKEDLPLKVFTPADDLFARLPHKQTLDQFAQSRGARFYLSDRMGGATYDFDKGYGTFRDRSYKLGLLDQLMMEIPGKNNYHGHLNDHSFNMTVLDASNMTANIPLNTAFYHRFFKYDAKGAMGIKTIHRGYADQNLFVAQTTQPNIAEIKVHDCKTSTLNHHHHKICANYSARYSYALPLEVIYLTPLYQWNPYNLYHHDRRHTYDVTRTGRNGGLQPDKAYNGTSFKFFYRTPEEFFASDRGEKDRADTNKGTVGVLDRQGVVRKVVTSGTHIHLQAIEGVGRLRTRYPIAPIHSEGSTNGKEISALKEVLNHMPSMSSILIEQPTGSFGTPHMPAASKHMQTSFTRKDPPGPHRHDIFVEQSDILQIQNGHTVTVTTSEDNSHTHAIEIGYGGNDTYHHAE